MVKNPPASAGDGGLIRRLGRSPGGGNGNALQCSCLGNPMDRRNLEGSIHGISKESDTTERLSLHFMDCSPPGSSVHGISQARTLEWVAIPISRGSSQPRDRTKTPAFFRQILYQLSHQGSPRILEWVAYLFSSGDLTQESNHGFLHCRWIL